MAIVWVVLAFLIGYFAAHEKGRSFWGWFLLSCLLSPLIGAILLMISRDRSDETATEGTKKCLYCAETVKKEATKCKHCGADLPAISSLQ